MTNLFCGGLARPKMLQRAYETKRTSEFFLFPILILALLVLAMAALENIFSRVCGLRYEL